MIIEITLNTGQYTLYNRPLQHEQLTPPKSRRTDIISNEQHLDKIDCLGTDTHCGWVNKANLTCTPSLPPPKKTQQQQQQTNPKTPHLFVYLDHML